MGRSDGSEGVIAKGRTRRELIEQTQLAVYECRSRCLRAKSQVGQVPFDLKHDFQDAIVDYYWALRPLRDEKVIADFWNEVELSEFWQHTVPDRPEVETNRKRGVDVDEPNTRSESVAGIDAIAALDDKVERFEVQRSTMRGRVTETGYEQQVLPFPVLKDLSSVLDDAAKRLGFTPETPQGDLPKDKLEA